MGRGLIKLEHYQEAIEAFEQSMRIRPDHNVRGVLDYAYGKLKSSQQSTSQYNSSSNNSNSSSNSYSGSGSSSCFIATAVYGSYDAHEVLILRRWRDNRLSSNRIGEKFIRFYYKISPRIASWIRDRALIRIVTREFLDIFINTWLRNYR